MAFLNLRGFSDFSLFMDSTGTISVKKTTFWWETFDKVRVATILLEGVKTLFKPLWTVLCFSLWRKVALTTRITAVYGCSAFTLAARSGLGIAAVCEWPCQSYWRGYGLICGQYLHSTLFVWLNFFQELIFLLHLHYTINICTDHPLQQIWIL